MVLLLAVAVGMAQNGPRDTTEPPGNNTQGDPGPDNSPPGRGDDGRDDGRGDSEENGRGANRSAGDEGNGPHGEERGRGPPSEDERGATRTRDRNGSDTRDEPPRGPPTDGPDGRERGGAKSDPPGSGRGRVVIENETVTGRYVAFTMDPGMGLLSDYRVGEHLFLQRLQAPGPFEAETHGARSELVGDNFTITIVDNPTGHLHLDPHNASFEAVPAQGAMMAADGGRVRLQFDPRIAHFTNGTVQDGTIHIGAASTFVVHGPDVVHVAQTPEPARAQVARAVLDGRVAARIEVMATGSDVLAYDTVNVTSQRLANGSHRFVVDAQLETGRAFVLDFAPGQAVEGSSVGVHYYRVENGLLVPRPMEAAASLEDALQINPEEPPSYYVTESQAGAQVVVAVPRFSVVAFEVFHVPPQVTPLVVYGVVLAVLVLALMAFGIVIGRRA